MTIEADVAAIDARVKVLEAGAEAKLKAVEAFWAKAVAFAKTSGGLVAVAAGGFAVSKFDIIGLLLKLI
jgi:hypothetical protein